jgi:predicted CXXCH cytochrome family protein
VKAWLVLLAAALFLTVGVVVALQQPEPEFPHEVHERLFPVCEGCHAGVVSGVEAELYPEPASCAECHDGERAERVEWSPPGPRASNLRFFHPEHRQLVRDAGERATCLACHAGSETPESRMDVASAQPDLCLACHAHPGQSHLEVPLGADCTGCHVPLTEAGALSIDRIAQFPWPDSHDQPDFLSRHAPDTPIERFSCAVCHARDTCERCHLNADRLDSVTELDRDPRVAFLETGKVPEYPLPESHEDPAWIRAHGPATLANPANCANCHARPSCLGCHLEGETRSLIVEFLPRPTPERPRGVTIDRAGERVHPVDFERNHRSWAATGALQCRECHSESYCADCHAGTDSRAFHPPNFMERHAVEVFAGAADCQSCHSTERFCRDCHVSVGVASRGTMNLAFHNAQPLWILAHGQAARTGLESCAACHGQSDCLACHSSVRGWGVNPHGPGFDAGRAAARNRLTCRWCHLGDPMSR